MAGVALAERIEADTRLLNATLLQQALDLGKPQGVADDGDSSLQYRARVRI